MKHGQALKVLLALPDRSLYFPIESALREAGFSIAIATNGDEAIRLISRDNPQLIILDRMLPKIGGITLCRGIRANPLMAETGIIMLGTSNDLPERVEALNAGADDYLVTPFAMEELLARISALQRRHQTMEAPQVLKAGPIEMIPSQWTVYANGEPVNLTEKEFRLLQELLQVKGRVLTREFLLEKVWGHDRSVRFGTRTVDVHMSRLRNKLGDAASTIITIRNIGYRISISPAWISQGNQLGNHKSPASPSAPIRRGP